MSARTPDADRAFVLGLDGIPWQQLDAWIDAGELPNFERLRNEGAAGSLESTMPPTTALAWPSIATGAWPDKHGIYGFQKLAGNYSHSMSTSRDWDHPALWDDLTPAVTANVPMTYPAREIDGDMVTGMMTPEMNDGFTHPPELGDEVRDRIPDYEIGLAWSEYEDSPDEFRDDLDSLLSARRELLRLLMEREDWRLFFFVFTAPDRLQHLLWDEDVMLDHYRDLDAVLGEVMEYVRAKGANLFVVSDHGFGPISKCVSVNRVLEREGYLATREAGGLRGVLSDLGLTKDAVLSSIESVGISEERLVRALPRSLVDGVAEQIPGSHVLYDVDYSNTRAFVHGPGCVYVNDTERFADGTVAPSDRESVKAAVRDVFEDVVDPETGREILRVFDGDDLFETDEDSPDLIVRPIHGYDKATNLNEEVVSAHGTAQATHRENGVFLAWGPDVEASSTVTGATVVDVAPTVLHSVGEPVPETADGSVLEDVFAARTAVTERAVEPATHGGGGGSVEPEDDFADVEDRLRGLGYMD